MPHEADEAVSDIHGGTKLAMHKPIIAGKLSLIYGIGPHLLRDFPRMITVCTIWREMYGNGVWMNMIEISIPPVPGTILWLVD